MKGLDKHPWSHSLGVGILLTGLGLGPYQPLTPGRARIYPRRKSTTPCLPAQARCSVSQAIGSGFGLFCHSRASTLKWVCGHHSGASASSPLGKSRGQSPLSAVKQAFTIQVFRNQPSLETAMPRPAVSDVMDTERSRSLPWGEREIESRDITWIILAASPLFKKERKNTPPKRRRPN